jgi:hypothetical protein
MCGCVIAFPKNIADLYNSPRAVAKMKNLPRYENITSYVFGFMPF